MQKWLHIAPQRRRFPAEQELGAPILPAMLPETLPAKLRAHEAKSRDAEKIKSDAHQPPVHQPATTAGHASTTLVTSRLIFNPQWPDTKSARANKRTSSGQTRRSNEFIKRFRL